MPQGIAYRGNQIWGIVLPMRPVLLVVAACSSPHSPMERMPTVLSPADETVVRAAPRAHGWDLWRQLHEGTPFAWETWPRSDLVMERADRRVRALQPFGHEVETLPIGFAVVFDPSAAAHVRAQHLASKAVLAGLTELPAFPRSAITLKLIWYRIKREGVTRMPIWDGEPARAAGNPDRTWKRWIDVGPGGVPLEAFEHHAIASADELRSARAAMHDDAIELGDSLALVAMHVSTKELPDWLWATFWWHDRPDVGPYAAGRPGTLSGAASHYLMDVTLASDAPSFNPWLEARFPDGVRSNCVTCHQRAVRGAMAYLPVTLAPLAPQDPYFAGTFQTDFVWTLALEAR